VSGHAGFVQMARNSPQKTILLSKKWRSRACEGGALTFVGTEKLKSMFYRAPRRGGRDAALSTRRTRRGARSVHGRVARKRAGGRLPRDAVRRQGAHLSREPSKEACLEPAPPSWPLCMAKAPGKFIENAVRACAAGVDPRAPNTVQWAACSGHQAIPRRGDALFAGRTETLSRARACSALLFESLLRGRALCVLAAAHLKCLLVRARLFLCSHHHRKLRSKSDVRWSRCGLLVVVACVFACVPVCVCACLPVCLCVCSRVSVSLVPCTLSEADRLNAERRDNSGTREAGGC
jgi:hypothetical protein